MGSSPEVLIDARLAARGLGIGTFVDRLMKGFAEVGGPAPFLWKPSSGRLREVAARSGPFDISPKLDPRTRHFDVVHFVCNVGSLFPGPTSVLTVHDLLHRRTPRARYRILGALLERSLPKAGQVVAGSSITAAEVSAAFPELARRIEVIPYGMRRLERWDGPREHLLGFGGGTDPRKRVDLMVAAYRAYRESTADPLPLVVLARAGLTEEQRRQLTGLEARILDNASGEEVDGLMRSAAAVLYSSIDEGFGLPILEAAEVGTPVVLDAAARVAGEAVGDHCVKVDGGDLSAWAEGIRIAAKMGPVEAGLQLADWPEVASRYLEIYRRACDGR